MFFAVSLLGVADALLHELLLFAGIGILIGSADDLLVDLLYFLRRSRRHRWRSRNGRLLSQRPASPGRFAIFIPAWDESVVIGAMLRTALARFDHPDFHIFVGTYPNDPGTLEAVAAVARSDARVQMVIGSRPGPTTKADCLNHLWRALLRAEIDSGVRYKGVVLHDAEDVVHPQELRLFDVHLERAAAVQLPVLPLVDPKSRLVSGHYADEFTEAHAKILIVREAVGAGVPFAGVGCAIGRDMLERIADLRGGEPFDADSLTEDYELGLIVARLGGRTAFIRAPAADGSLVAVRAYFPATVHAAVRQKARWMTGIALAGWDRVGWARPAAISDQRSLDAHARPARHPCDPHISNSLYVAGGRKRAGGGALGDRHRRAAGLARLCRAAMGQCGDDGVAADDADAVRVARLWLARGIMGGAARVRGGLYRAAGGAAGGVAVYRVSARHPRAVGKDRASLSHRHRTTGDMNAPGRGRPLRFVAIVGGLWVGTRAVMLWPHAVPVPVILPSETPAQQQFSGPRPAPHSAEIAIKRENRAYKEIFISRSRATARTTRFSMPLMKAEPATILLHADENHAAARPLPLPLPLPQTSAPTILPPGAPPLALPPAQASRWQVSGWAMTRGGSAGSLAGPALGGDQAGVRVTYAIDPARRVWLAGRLAAPLRGKGSEATVGVEWQPLPVPVRLVAEYRVPIDRKGTGDPGLGVIGGVYGVKLPADFRLEAYGQAGIIARERSEPYADGAVRIGRRVAAIERTALSLGAGMWGGAQRGAERIDIGPSAVFQMPAAGGNLRLSLDWRQRVMGGARPGSGPAVTLGADF